FFKIVIQLNPACAASRISISNKCRSSCTGTPHSLSWYSMYRSPLAQEQRVLESAIEKPKLECSKKLSSEIKNRSRGRQSALISIQRSRRLTSAAAKFEKQKSPFLRTGFAIHSG